MNFVFRNCLEPDQYSHSYHKWRENNIFIGEESNGTDLWDEELILLVKCDNTSNLFKGSPHHSANPIVLCSQVTITGLQMDFIKIL